MESSQETTRMKGASLASSAVHSTFSKALESSKINGINDKKGKGFGGPTVLVSADEKHAPSATETSILGASHAAREGTISRMMTRSTGGGRGLFKVNSTATFTTEATIPTVAERKNRSKPVQKEEGNTPGGFQPLHVRLMTILKDEWNLRQSGSILGATSASRDGSRRNSISRFSSIDREFGQNRGLRLPTEEAMKAFIDSGASTALDRAMDTMKKKKAGAALGQTVWKPGNCPLRYATYYPIVLHEQPKAVEITSPPSEKPLEASVDFGAMRKTWCGCCMREAFDPYELPCGHSFCRRCIVDMNFFLLKDNSEAVNDTRAVMRCPLRYCKAVIRCLPLVNGDFRFKLVRPEDKVALKETLNLCEQHRLHTYKIRVDMDVTKRRSDNLFDGYDDVIVIP